MLAPSVGACSHRDLPAARMPTKRLAATARRFGFYVLVWMCTVAVHGGHAAHAPSSAPSPSTPAHAHGAGFVNFQFAVQPRDTVAARGGAFRLDCVATATRTDGVTTTTVAPPPSVSWRKDGVQLAALVDERRRLLANGSLLVQGVVHARHHRPDDGTYQCLAALDGVGVATSRTATVTVAGPLRLLSPPPSAPEWASAFPGGSALVRCDVTGEPPPAVRWQRDRQDLPLSSSSSPSSSSSSPSSSPLDPEDRLVLLPSGALQLSDVRPQDTAAYRCLGRNPAAIRTGSEVTLRVLPEPSEARPLHFLQKPSRATPLLGDHVVLECSASGFPNPTFTWLRGSEVIMSRSKKYSLLGGSNLLINTVTVDDSGTYTCVATNRKQNISTSCELSVLVPPHFLVFPSNTLALESSDVELECSVTGSPAPSVRWLKDGEDVVPSDYFQMVDGWNLQILGLVPSDAGIYQCIAESVAGSDAAGVQLLLHPPAFPRPDAALPSAPRDLAAILVSSRSVRLGWRPPALPGGRREEGGGGGGGSGVQTYGVFYSEEGNERERCVNVTEALQLTVFNLRPGRAFSFRVVAYDHVGPGESSEKLRVTTPLDDRVSTQVLKLTADALSPTSILVRWEAPSQTNGALLGYRLLWADLPSGKEQVAMLTQLAFS